jgi:hypothetical protein
MHPPSSNPSPASGSAHQRRGQTYYRKRSPKKSNAFDSLTERLVAAMLTLLSTIGFAHDLPYARSQK